MRNRLIIFLPGLLLCLLGGANAAEVASAPATIKDPFEAAQEAAQRAGLPKSIRKALSAIATDPENRDRQRAVLTLGENRANDPASVKAIASAADATDPVLRACVMWSLGRCGNASSTKSLKKALTDADPAVRAAACKALAELDVADAPWPLTDPDAGVRLAAVESIRHFLLFPLSMNRHAENFKDSTSLLLGFLPEKDNVRSPAQVAKPVADRLVQQLAAAFAKETDVRVQPAMLAALAELDPRESLSAMRSALLGDNTTMQMAALAGLSMLPAAQKDTVADLGATVRSLAAVGKPWQTRVAAAWALRQIDPAWPAKNLSAWCTDENQYMRQTAADILGFSGDAASVAALERLLGDPVYEVRRLASIALFRYAESKRLKRDELEKIAAAAANDNDLRRAGSGLWILAQLKSQAGFPGALKHAQLDSKEQGEQSAVVAQLMYLIGASRYSEGADAAQRCFLDTSAVTDCRLQAIHALALLQHTPSVAPVLKALAQTQVIEKTKIWVLAGRLRKEAILMTLQVGGPVVIEGMLNDILNPDPLEEETLVALVCQWLVDTKATVAAEDIGGAMKASVFSSYMRESLQWTHARLTGQDVPAEIPVPTPQLSLPSFLTATR